LSGVDGWGLRVTGVGLMVSGFGSTVRGSGLVFGVWVLPPPVAVMAPVPCTERDVC